MPVASPKILRLLTPGFRPYNFPSRFKSRLQLKHFATMTPPISAEDSKLIADLHALSKKSPKLVKSSTYSAPADPSITVRSWKMNEFKYYDVPSPFPTLARGIFTVELPKTEENDAQQYRIVVRGYDKFFNIGEVPWTTVSTFVSCISYSSDYCCSGIPWKCIHHLLTHSRSSPMAALSSSLP